MQRRSIDPDLLFGRSCFVLLCLAVSSATLFVCLTRQKSPEGSIPAGVDPPPAGNIEGIVDAMPMTPYRHGYISGFNAFLAQTDQPPLQMTTVSYTSSKDYDPEDKEIERGYVDGYHRATEALSCPRVYYEY